MRLFTTDSVGWCRFISSGIAKVDLCSAQCYDVHVHKKGPAKCCNVRLESLRGRYQRENPVKDSSFFDDEHISLLESTLK